MDTAFTHLLAMLGGIADPRRAEGKLYGLPHVFLFSILAVMAGANSYRAIHSFLDVHLHRLKETFELNWKRAPAYTTVRGILQGLAVGDVESVFRLHAQILNENAACQGMRVVAFDGKTLRGSFDNFADMRRPTWSAPSPPIAPWCWAILRSTTSPTRSRPSSACSANSGWPRAWSPWMRCIVKKNLRTRR
jgi:hypothetical protein